MNAACSGLCACHREAKCFLSSRYADTPAAASRCGGTAEGWPSLDGAAKMGPNMVRAPRGREGRRTREGTCGPRRGSRRLKRTFLGARHDGRSEGAATFPGFTSATDAHHQRHPCASSCAAHCLSQHRHLLLRTAPHSLPLRAIAPPRRQWPSPTRSRRLSGR